MAKSKEKKKDRAWLREFLNLGARAQEEHIAQDVIELQEDTVLAALDILDREPGVLLADEVGMGKTFQTLGILACAFKHDPKTRVMVVTPTRELNEQWYWFAHRFNEWGFFRFKPGIFGMINDLRELPSRSRKHPVVFAPLSVFTGARAQQERGFLLALWGKYAKIPPRRLAEIRRRIHAAEVQTAPGRDFLGHSIQQLARKRLALAFRRAKSETRGFKGLSDLDAEGMSAFDSAATVRRALDRARFHVVSTLMRPFNFLVVDEAHKLKDPWTVRAQAVTLVMRKNYDKAIFLTATPFQLGIKELQQVFQLFDNARTAREDFLKDVERLFDSVRTYQQAYDQFEAAWQYVDDRQAREFARWYELASLGKDPAFHRIADPNVRAMAERAWTLIRLKEEQVEPSFRQWTLRSLKPGRRGRRQTVVTRLLPDEEAVLPVVLYQRLLLEAGSDGRRRAQPGTIDINMASSYSAARASRLLHEKGASPSARSYQNIVRKVLRTVPDKHPKLDHVLTEVLAAGQAGEKTLIFCERNASIRALQKSIETAWLQLQMQTWNQVCPGATFDEVFGSGSGRRRMRGLTEKVPPRFFRGSDELSMALAESFPYTLLLPPGTMSELPREFWRASGAVLQHANRLLTQQKVWPAVATRLDYPLASRCIDQAVAHWFKKNRSGSLAGYGGLAANLLHANYPSAGISLMRRDRGGRAADLTRVEWSISRSTFDSILSPRRPGIWFPFRERLARLTPEVRALVVDAVRYYFTRREAAFCAQLLERVGRHDATSEQLRHAIEIWLAEKSSPWRMRIQELLEYLPCLTVAEQKEVLQHLLRSPRVVQNGLIPSSRIARQNAFNAPFYPMVLIGNQAMQQGLDLHRQCRRIVHYDLRWNPTDLEQRIGRVERHGCLAERFSADKPEGRVHIFYPLVNGTADPQLYRSVRVREKWMEFLLGQPPMIGEYDINETPPQPLPQKLVQNLRVKLGPRSRESRLPGAAAKTKSGKRQSVRKAKAN